jgi:hypothetical protein
MFATPYMLRLRVKSMGYVAREIRFDEQHCQHHASLGQSGASEAREALHNMRTHSLRKEARAANLAYGFFLGRSYSQMEQTCHERPDLARVEALVERYSGDLDKRQVKQRFAQWWGEAREYLIANPPMSEVPPEREPAKIDPEIEYLSPIGIRFSSPYRFPMRFYPI